MDKETIEEAKFKSYKEYWNEYHTQLVKSNFLNGFENGAKWQMERMYSEEDMKKAFKVGFSVGYGIDTYAIEERNKTCEEWFEWFKKK